MGYWFHPLVSSFWVPLLILLFRQNYKRSFHPLPLPITLNSKLRVVTFGEWRLGHLGVYKSHLVSEEVTPGVWPLDLCSGPDSKGKHERFLYCYRHYDLKTPLSVTFVLFTSHLFSVQISDEVLVKDSYDIWYEHHGKVCNQLISLNKQELSSIPSYNWTIVKQSVSKHNKIRRPPSRTSPTLPTSPWAQESILVWNVFSTM